MTILYNKYYDLRTIHRQILCILAKRRATEKECQLGVKSSTKLMKGAFRAHLGDNSGKVEARLKEVLARFGDKRITHAQIEKMLGYSIKGRYDLGKA